MPPTNPTVDAPDERTAEVLGYLRGNCVHCHNGRTVFDLRQEVALENLIDQPTASSGVEVGIRVVPGDPEASVLLAVLDGESDTTMPPLGVQIRDESAIRKVREWIRELD